MEKIKVTIALRKGIDPDFGWWDRVQVKAVQWWTKSEYYHSEIILDDKWVSAHLENGIVIQYLKPLKNNWDYIEIGEVELTNQQHTYISDWVKSQEGIEYDWKGIWFSQFISLNSHNKRKWFCSEITSKILQLLLVKEYMDIIPNNVSPADIWEMSKHRK